MSTMVKPFNTDYNTRKLQIVNIIKWLLDFLIYAVMVIARTGLDPRPQARAHC